MSAAPRMTRLGGSRVPARRADARHVAVVGPAAAAEDADVRVAGYCYQDRLFDQQVRDLSASAVVAWRRRFRARLDRIAARYPPRMAVDLDGLADMLSAVADGGIILSKVLHDKDALPRQILLYREFVRAVFLVT